MIIAVSIFIFLAVIMVSFLQKGLDVWKSSEAKGDILQRSQAITEQIKKDALSLFNEPDSRTVVPYNFYSTLPRQIDYSYEPSLYCGPDALRNQWLYLIRLDDDNLYTTVSPTSVLQPGRVCFKAKERVAYWLDSANLRLVRDVITETVASSFWQNGLEASGQTPAPTGRETFDNVIYFGCVISGTTQWDSRVSAGAVQPDAYRVAPQDLPTSIRITLDIKPLAFNAPRLALAEGISAGITELKASVPGALLGAGSFIRIDDEWMLVEKRSRYNLIVTRGARGTTPAGHSAGEEILYGDTTETVIYLPSSKR